MRSLRSESLLVLPLFPIFLAGAFPFLLMGFLGFAGIGILGLLMMSAALTVAFDADTEFNVQRSAARVAGRVIPSSTRDSMVRFAKAVGISGAGWSRLPSQVLRSALKSLAGDSFICRPIAGMR